MAVVKQTDGTYVVQVVDDPTVTRTDLDLRYGELVQGYRVIVFGKTWASVQHAIGRTRQGLNVMYKTARAPGIDTSVWGRFAQVQVMDGVSDENDLLRRIAQAAIDSGKLGHQIALGIRSGFLTPGFGYDVTDAIPITIQYGGVDTTRYGSGYWCVYAIAWEAGDDQSQAVNLTLLPRDDATAPNSDLIPSAPLSPQAEWQIGWTAPDPVKATSLYFLDQNTGKVYIRDESSGSAVYNELTDGSVLAWASSPVAPTKPTISAVASAATLDADGHSVVRITVVVA